MKVNLKTLEEVKAILTEMKKGKIDRPFSFSEMTRAVNNLIKEISDFSFSQTPRLEQIQIITTQECIQSFVDAAVRQAFSKLNLNTGPLLNQERPITVKELCEFLGLTEATIIRWCKKGKIPYMQVGSRILFNKAAVLAALEVKVK